MGLTNSKIISLGKGFWKKERKMSGKEIDIIRGQNIPHNSKTIDRTVGLSCIISHKSTDVRRKSYSNPSSIYRLGMRFVRELSLYSGEIRRDHQKMATYYLNWTLEGENTLRILEWFIPANNITNEQEEKIKKVVMDAKKLEVTVQIFQVLD